MYYNVYFYIMHYNLLITINSISYNCTITSGQIKCKEQFEMIRGLDENDAINITIGDAIKALWTDPGKNTNFHSFIL